MTFLENPLSRLGRGFAQSETTTNPTLLNNLVIFNQVKGD